MLSFEVKAVETEHKEYFLSKVKIKDYNMMIDGCGLFEQPVRNEIKLYGNSRKNVTGQGGDYTTA